jgi:transposase InsO family protein
VELHGNARLTPHGRALMCRRVRVLGWSPKTAAEAAGCSERTCYRWLARFDAGEPLTDRPSTPHRVPNRTSPGHRVTGRGPGHYNNKPGWDAVHVCVDDTTRLAYVEVLADETALTSVGFLARALAWFRARGVTVQRVMTDNGAPYKSRAWAAWCADHDIRHLRTRPYRPRTNGKAERFIQTMLREWAYAATYPNSHERTIALEPWLAYYNQQRPHSALGHKTPASRLTTATD